MLSNEDVEDDGLETPVTGDWGLEKYRLVECYARLFATSMKKVWDKRVYVDLFAGAGRTRIRDTHRIANAVPLRVLGLPDPFDRHVFCERDVKKLEALRNRVAQLHSGLSVQFLRGDTNEMVDEILQLTASFDDRLGFSRPRRLARDVANRNKASIW